MSDDELRRLFDSMAYSGDPHEYIWPNSGGRSVCAVEVGAAVRRIRAAMRGRRALERREADRKIEEIITRHRERNIGFHGGWDPSIRRLICVSVWSSMA